MMLRLKIRIMKNNIEGECPNCGSENIEYGYTEIDDDGVGYAYKCNDCGHYDTECYDLVFTTHASCIE
jgi:predicted RNA-binding Zn-ribbon protein involved in translation (DUF1610 family)